MTMTINRSHIYRNAPRFLKTMGDKGESQLVADKSLSTMISKANLQVALASLADPLNRHKYSIAVYPRSIVAKHRRGKIETVLRLAVEGSTNLSLEVTKLTYLTNDLAASSVLYKGSTQDLIKRVMNLLGEVDAANSTSTAVVGHATV